MNSRCDYCRYKTLVILECNCKQKLCTKHIQPEKHQCCKVHDYAKKDRDYISKKIYSEATQVKKVEII